MRTLVLALGAWLAAGTILAGAERVPTYHWNLPAWAAPPIVPPDNPMTEQKVTLGRYLFYDKRLSLNRTFSCATCHQQRYGFTDLKPTAIGSTGQHHPRRASTLTNVAYNTALTWANPLQRKLEKQMLVPMFGEHPVELGLAGHEKDLIARLAMDERYRGLFKAAFPQESNPISLGTITKAIASFERTLISLSSPYDRYRYGGEESAISAPAKRGEALFFSERLQCFHCHGGVNFTDSSADTRTRIFRVAYHNNGLYNIGPDGDYPRDNPGIYEFTHQDKDKGAFKVPTLRNVAVRAPYMHDGSVKDLEAVLDHYSAGGRTIASGPYRGIGRLNPHKDLVLKGFSLTPRDRSDLIAFFNSLTDEQFLTNPAFSDPFAVQRFGHH
ncbi:MAG TPA: MbnH family di-heme enzyme [Candidatus Baltobacteraceae bacterium]|nr:MbnH family di-heme enzyme [Candidatus Baltobacteraceae bacterium]